MHKGSNTRGNIQSLLEREVRDLRHRIKNYDDMTLYLKAEVGGPPYFRDVVPSDVQVDEDQRHWANLLRGGLVITNSEDWYLATYGLVGIAGLVLGHFGMLMAGADENDGQGLGWGGVLILAVPAALWTWGMWAAVKKGVQARKRQRAAIMTRVKELLRERDELLLKRLEDAADAPCACGDPPVVDPPLVRHLCPSCGFRHGWDGDRCKNCGFSS